MKFLVFKNGQQVTDFPLSGTYLFGADMIPLRHVDSIAFEGDCLECRKKSRESAGLALLWPVEGSGRLLLPTTRLPDRPEPYILNVELARARMMQITLKREDWALFDQTKALDKQAQEIQHSFIQALQHIADPAKASVYADEALKKGVAFSERMAAKYAEQFLSVRFRNKALGRHSLGCQLDPARLDNDKYRKWLTDMFGFVTIPTNWRQIETDKGEYDFGSLDAAFEALAGRRLALCVGPLLKFTPETVPEWLLAEKPSFEKIRESAYAFVTAIVQRYSKSVHAWRVISGINAQNCFGFNFEQVIEMTRTACLAAKTVDTKSRKMVDIVFPWGEYYAHDKTAVPPLVYADMVIQSGIGFDAFGLQFHFGADTPGLHVRDMMQISSRLDCFAGVPKTVHITGVSVPDCDGTGDRDAERAGSWRDRWSQTQQAKWIEEFYKLALGRPYINTVTYSQLADDSENGVDGCGLLTRDMTPKKAFLIMAKFQKTIMKQ